MSRNFGRTAAGCIIVTLVSASRVHSAEPPFRPEQLAAGAMMAQTRCYGLIHHDTWEFGDCVRTLAVTGGQAEDLRLGIEYFGWLGAMNSARLGMLGADETAREFLVRFRKTQKKLKVDDRTLCAAVPGECVARTARLRQMETELPMDSASKKR